MGKTSTSIHLTSILHGVFLENIKFTSLRKFRSSLDFFFRKALMTFYAIQIFREITEVRSCGGEMGGAPPPSTTTRAAPSTTRAPSPSTTTRAPASTNVSIL